MDMPSSTGDQLHKGPPPDIDPTLGRVLKRLREDQGLNPTNLACRAGLDAATLSQIERGRLDPPWRTVESVARGLGVSLHELASVVENARRS